MILFCFCAGCGHCKSARPHFEQAATIVQVEKNKMMTTVDCTVETGGSRDLTLVRNLHQDYRLYSISSKQ